MPLAVLAPKNTNHHHHRHHIFFSEASPTFLEGNPIGNIAFNLRWWQTSCKVHIITSRRMTPKRTIGKARRGGGGSRLSSPGDAPVDGVPQSSRGTMHHAVERRCAARQVGRAAQSNRQGTSGRLSRRLAVYRVFKGNSSPSENVSLIICRQILCLKCEEKSVCSIWAEITQFCKYVFFIFAIKEMNASSWTTNQLRVFPIMWYFSALIGERVLTRTGNKRENTI